MHRSPLPSRLAVLATSTILCVMLVACQGRPSEGGLLPGLYARIETNRGPIVVELDYQRAPLAAANFVGLAEGRLKASWGRPFYDGLSFHSVQDGLLVQGGCPVGDGSGGPGYIFPDEFHPALRHDAPGSLGMANYGPDTNGSQFYLSLQALPALDGHYTTFGRLVSGLEVLAKIRPGDSIRRLRIERIGADAQAFAGDQEAWDELLGRALIQAAERLRADRQQAVKAIQEAWPELEADTHGILNSVRQPGSGPRPELGSTVRVLYTGWLPDGRIFDQANDAAEPFSFALGLGQVIEGWELTVAGMAMGERRLVALPPELAYGSAGLPGVIPGNSYLVFEIELLGAD